MLLFTIDHSTNQRIKRKLLTLDDLNCSSSNDVKQVSSIIQNSRYKSTLKYTTDLLNKTYDINDDGGDLVNELYPPHIHTRNHMTICGIKNTRSRSHARTGAIKFNSMCVLFG